MSLLKRVKARVNIVDLISQSVKLKKLRDRHVGLCPFHNEGTPSFSVSPKGFYFCFGCGVKGDHIKFLMDHDGLTFVESKKKLAEMARVTIPKPSRNEIIRNLVRQGKASEALKLAEKERYESNRKRNARRYKQWQES